MLTLSIYDSAERQILLAQYDDELRPPYGGGLRFSTNAHGFASLAAEMIPMTLEQAFAAYGWAGTPHVVASDNGMIIWEGRLEDVAIIPQGVRFGAFGYVRALTDVPYTALWSDSSVRRWDIGTQADSSTITPEKWEQDSNNRLFFAPRKNELMGSSYRAAFYYRVPDGGENNIVEISFDYALLASSAWTLRLWGSTALWTLSGTGVLQTGSVTQSISPSQATVFFDYYRTTSATYTGETGANYAKITNVRVKAAAGSILASNIAKTLAAYVNGINGDHISAATALIEATAEDLQDEVYEDALPLDILDDLGQRHGYEAGVWEGQRLHFRTRGSRGRDFYVDVTRILSLERSLEPLVNSTYGVFRDRMGVKQRTAVSDDNFVISRYGLTRRRFIKADTTSESQAEAYRDLFLADVAAVGLRAEIEFDRLFDATGSEYRLFELRAGDTLTMRNLPPTLGNDVENLRTFLIAATEYAASPETIRVEPASPIPTLVTLVAARPGEV